MQKTGFSKMRILLQNKIYSAPKLPNHVPASLENDLKDFTVSDAACAEGISLEGKSVFFVAQSCLTLCDPMDCSPPGSSVHGILQARILEWVAMLSSRGPSPPGTEPTALSSLALAGRLLTISTVAWEAPRESLWSLKYSKPQGEAYISPGTNTHEMPV